MKNGLKILWLVNGVALTLLLIGVLSVFSQFVPEEATDSGLGGNNNIVGTVYTLGGRLTRRVNIRLTTMTRGDSVASTDDNGNFSFKGLTAGTYTVVIDKEKDFEPFTQVVEIIQMRGSPPQTYTLSVRLNPKSGAQPKAGVIDAAVANLSEHGRALYAKAQELAAAGDTNGEIEQLILLIQEAPNFMPGFNELGVAYMRIGQPEKAEAAFQSALKIDPKAFAPQLGSGIALVTLKRYAEAETILQSAKKQNDNSAPVRFFLGQALANLGKFDEAVPELTAAISMGGKEMVEAHRTLAIIYSSKGDKKKAAAELETYLQMNPTAQDAEQLKKVLEQFKAVASQPPSAAQKPD